MKQLTNYINAVSNHLASDIDLGDALRKAQPIIMQMKPQDRTVWFHTNIAPLVAKSYAVEVVMTRNGTTSFNNKAGKRADTAFSKFRYVTQITLVGKPKPSVSKQVDRVDLAKRKAEKFADSHKAVEIRNEIAYIEVYLKSLKSYV